MTAGPNLDFNRLGQFNYAIITLVGSDGFPMSLPTDFQVTPRNEILLKKPSSQAPLEGKTVGVLFNHITPIPTGGYTDRRYIQIWGKLNGQRDQFRLKPERVSEWDEKILSFPELCAKSAPQGQRYLELVQSQIEA